MSSVQAGDALALNPKVSLRPEPFGALAYHFGNRKLSFLKEPALVEVVRALEAHDSVLDALRACDVPENKHAAYLKALGSLVDSDMVVPRAQS